MSQHYLPKYYGAAGCEVLRGSLSVRKDFAVNNVLRDGTDEVLIQIQVRKFRHVGYRRRELHQLVAPEMQLRDVGKSPIIMCEQCCDC